MIFLWISSGSFRKTKSVEFSREKQSHSVDKCILVYFVRNHLHPVCNWPRKVGTESLCSMHQSWKALKVRPAVRRKFWMHREIGAIECQEVLIHYPAIRRFFFFLGGGGRDQVIFFFLAGEKKKPDTIVCQFVCRPLIKGSVNGNVGHVIRQAWANQNLPEVASLAANLQIKARNVS